MNLPSLDEWTLSGKEMRKLIYEAGFNSPYAFSQYFALNYGKVMKWLRMPTVPDGRIIGAALIGLRCKAQIERVERELAVYKAKENQEAA